MVQQSRTIENGSTMINQMLRYHTIELADTPPQEVLDLLEQVIP